MKRLISIVLTFTMLLAFCGVQVSAAAITSTHRDIVSFDGGMSTTKSNTLTSVTSLTSGWFYATDNSYPYSYKSSSAIGISVSGGSGVTNATRSGDTSGCYLASSGSTLTSSYFNFGGTLKGYGYVLSVSYDVMIPDDANVDSERSYTPTFGANSTAGKSPSSFTIKYDDKKFTIDQTSMTGIDTTTVVTDTVVYTPGSWVNMELRAYYDSTTQLLTYGVYIDEAQIFYAKGNVEYVFDSSTTKATMYLSKFVWSQPSGATYYDNIYYRALTAADASTTFTPVYVEEALTSKTLVIFDGVNPGSTAITTGNFAPSEDSVVGTNKSIALSSAGSGSVQSLQDASSNWYIQNSHSLLKYMPKTTYDLVAQVNEYSLPVITLSYDFMIPADTNSATERTFTLNAGATAGENELAVVYNDGEIYVDETELVGIDTTTVVSNKIDYTPGTWSKLDVRAYYDATTKKLTYGVYVGETQIFYGVGNVTITNLYIQEGAWAQTVGVTTNMDNIVVGLLQEADKPVVIEKIEEIAEPVDILNWDFNTMTTTAASTLAVKSVGALTKNIVNSTASTSKVSSYAGESVADGDMALAVTTTKENIEGKASNATVMVSIVKSSLNSYIATDGTESVLTGSYDIYIPSDSKDTKRKHMFSFLGNDTNEAGSTHDIYLTSYIDNGYLYFDTEFNTTNAVQVDFKERSEEVAFDCDDWETVNYVIKTTFDTDRYIVKLYGIYKDKCYYENTVEVMGKYFLIVNNSFFITGSDDKDFTTKYDNIKLTSVPNYSEELVYGWASANYIYPLVIDATTSEVEAKAKAVGNYANLCMVTAVYNADGKFLKLWTDKELDSDGFLSCKITDSSYLVKGYKVKAFVFDSLTSAVPQVEKAELTIQ